MKIKLSVHIITVMLTLVFSAVGSNQPAFAFNKEYNQGIEFEKKGLHKKAIKFYLKAAKAIRRKFGKNHFNNGVIAYGLALNYQKIANYSEAGKYYKIALKAYQKKKGKRSMQVARLLNTLGEVYRKQSRYADALSFYQRSLKIKKAKLGSNHPWVAETITNIANVYEVQGRLADALSLYQRSLEIFETKLGPNHLTVARIINNLAVVYEQQDRYTDALSLYQRSLKILEAKFGPDHPDVAVILTNLADVYEKQGRYSDALSLYQRSLKIDEAKLGPNHPDVARTLNNLAITYRELGRYMDALSLYQRSLKIFEAKLGPNHLTVARILTNLAVVYEKQGRYTDALPLYQRSLKIKKAKLGPNHPGVAGTLNNIAIIYKKQGRYMDALPLYQRSLNIREAKLGPDHTDVAQSLTNLAFVYEAQGSYANALPLYQRSLKIKEIKFGSDHPEVAQALNNLAVVYYRKKYFDKAFQLATKATHILKKRELKLVSAKSGQVDEKQNKSPFYYKAFIAHTLAIQEDTPPEEQSRLKNEGFQAGQDALSGDIGKALAQMSARFASGSNQLAKLIRARQDKIKNWQQLDKTLIASLSATGKARDKQKIARLRQQKTSVDEDIQSLTVHLEKSFPEFSQLSKPQPLSISDVQKQLSTEEALLLFLPAGKKGLAWAITKDRAEWAQVDLSMKELNEQISTLRSYLNTDINQVMEKKAPLFNLQKAHNLYQTLFPAHIQQTIEGKAKLLIVAGGALSSLPFHVLVTDQPTEAVPANIADYKDIAWFAKKYSSTILPSVSSLKALRQFAQKGQAQKPLVGFANPDFGGGEQAATARGRKVADLTSRSFKSFYRGGVVDTALLGANLAQLPDTEDELKTVASTLGVPTSEILVGKAATETRLKKMKLDDYKIVYFATHGLVAGELEQLGAKDKAEPALVLTVPAKGSDKDDGLLTASEVAQLKLNADWVVLSACNTAAGDKPGAQALSGLARAFIYSGARSLLVSHWPVVSDAAVKLTTKLFDLRLQNKEMDKAQALQQSMLSLMNDPSDPINAYPTMWAPFIVVGD